MMKKETWGQRYIKQREQEYPDESKGTALYAFIELSKAMDVIVGAFVDALVGTIERSPLNQDRPNSAANEN